MPGIFQHFLTKEHIWDAVGQHIGRLLQAKAAFTRKKGTLPVDELHDLVMGHLTFFEATPAKPAIFFHENCTPKMKNCAAFLPALSPARHRLFFKLIAAEIEEGRFKKT